MTSDEKLVIIRTRLANMEASFLAILHQVPQLMVVGADVLMPIKKLAFECQQIARTLNNLPLSTQAEIDELERRAQADADAIVAAALGEKLDLN